MQKIFAFGIKKLHLVKQQQQVEQKAVNLYTVVSRKCIAKVSVAVFLLTANYTTYFCLFSYLSQMKIIMLLTFLIYGNKAPAQTAEDSVKAVMSKMFTAMKNADGKKMASCFTDSAVAQLITTTMFGKPIVTNETYLQYIALFSTLPKNTVEKKLTFNVVKTDGPLAPAWVPYQHYYRGEFNSCGTMSIQLVRLSGIWKIQYMIDTQKLSGCK